MIDLNFSREFFAAMLVTEVEKVGFAVLIRTFPDAMELQHPAVLIRGIREFAFDIAEGCFVRLGARCDGKIEALRSGISKSGSRRWITCTGSPSFGKNMWTGSSILF